MSLLTTIICLCIAFILGWKTCEFFVNYGIKETLRRGELFTKRSGEWYPYDPTATKEELMRMLADIERIQKEAQNEGRKDRS
jgi:hypothetical protein